MRTRRDHYAKSHGNKSKSGQVRRRNAAAAATRKQQEQPKSRRCVNSRSAKEPFAPPEDWHEPTGDGGDYKVIVQKPGPEYSHVLTPQEVRDRLAELPSHFLRDLEVVQMSRMTRKKQSFPCYGMQWGATLYLYPIEESLTEHFWTPPSPAVFNEARMYGGKWDQSTPGLWTLTWSEAAIKDFYLNNILIHELGHLLDERNSTYNEREQYAEWFAIEYGYRRTGGREARRQNVKRRHHAT